MRKGKGERIKKGIRAIGIISFLLWLGSKTRRLWHDSIIYRLNSLLMNCRSFRVLTKALFLLFCDPKLFLNLKIAELKLMSLSLLEHS